ncbi:hypothetical protein PFISCL1PPCAC_21049, partial [Pristionchus fissidentatus]
LALHTHHNVIRGLRFESTNRNRPGKPCDDFLRRVKFFVEIPSIVNFDSNQIGIVDCNVHIGNGLLSLGSFAGWRLGHPESIP